MFSRNNLIKSILFSLSILKASLLPRQLKPWIWKPFKTTHDLIKLRRVDTEISPKESASRIKVSLNISLLSKNPTHVKDKIIALLVKKFDLPVNFSDILEETLNS